MLNFFLVIRFQILVRTETGGEPEGPPFGATLIPLPDSFLQSAQTLINIPMELHPVSCIHTPICSVWGRKSGYPQRLRIDAFIGIFSYVVPPNSIGSCRRILLSSNVLLSAASTGIIALQSVHSRMKTFPSDIVASSAEIALSMVLSLFSSISPLQEICTISPTLITP